MNNWIPKNKTIEFIATLAFLSVALYFIGLFVVLNEIKKVKDFYTNTESESSKEQRFLAIKSIAEKNEETIQFLRSFFVKKGDEVMFIEKIEETAKISSIEFEIIAIDVKPNQEDTFKENIDLKMRIAGTWDNLILFIDNLEKMNFGVLIKNINLGVKDTDGWSGFIDFVIFREK